MALNAWLAASSARVTLHQDLERSLRRPDKARRWVMVIDLRKCVGCHGCTIACQVENKLPPQLYYRPVHEYESGKYPTPSRTYRLGWDVEDRLCSISIVHDSWTITHFEQPLDALPLRVHGRYLKMSMIHGQIRKSDNAMPRPRDLPPEPMLQAALAALPENLGLTFTKAVDLDAEDGPCDVLTATWEGGRRTLRIHTQQIHRAEDLGHLKARLADPDDVLLLTPYLTANLGRKCLDLGLQFIDMAGNIHLTGQGLHVFVVGNKLDGKPEGLGPVRPFKAFNHKGLQVVFALLAGEGMVGATYRELGRAAEVATGTVGLVMQDLTAAGLMVATPTGRVMLQPERVVEGWVANFPHKLRPHLHPTRFQATRTEGWKDLDLTPYGAQWGGELAGDRLTHHLQPRTATIYTHDNAAKLAGALRLRPDPQGDIEILDQFWDFPNPQDYPVDLVPPLLIYADLVASGDPRNTDIARMIHAHHLYPEQPRP